VVLVQFSLGFFVVLRLDFQALLSMAELIVAWTLNESWQRFNQELMLGALRTPVRTGILSFIDILVCGSSAVVSGNVWVCGCVTRGCGCIAEVISKAQMRW